MRKRILLWTTVLLILVGIAGVITPFALALKPNPRGRNDDTYVTTLVIKGIRDGELQSVRVGNRNLFIFRPTPVQWQNIHRLDAHVWDPGMAAWNPQLGAFFYWGYGTLRPYTLIEEPVQGTHPKRQPWEPGWEPDRPLWQGGYIDIDRDMSYDYAGRAIRDLDYTYTGFSLDVPNLWPAQVEQISPEQIAVCCSLPVMWWR